MTDRIRSGPVANAALFLILLVAGGAGGFFGSIGGSFAGRPGLWAGGILGGLLMSAAAALFASWLRLISADEVASVALGTACGFLAATAIAVNTLNSPWGPILSTSLIGIGGLVGRRFHAPRSA